MLSRGFAYPAPVQSHLIGRTLALGLHDLLVLLC
jgi:hypothetical protein